MKVSKTTNYEKNVVYGVYVSGFMLFFRLLFVLVSKEGVFFLV